MICYLCTTYIPFINSLHTAIPRQCNACNQAQRRVVLTDDTVIIH